jgi:hypothetical protein
MPQFPSVSSTKQHRQTPSGQPRSCKRKFSVCTNDEARLRRVAFKTAIVLYLLGLLDMGVNVLISGVVGWTTQ